MNWLHQVLVALDQLINAILNGFADETLSSRAYRAQLKGHRYFGWTANAINALFYWQANHCRGAFVAERERRQLPPEFRA